MFPLHLAAFEQPAPSPGAVRDSEKEGEMFMPIE
jgi:hypothetical protein